MQRFTEGEVTSLVRRFFRKNDFHFLSTSANGDKLYYTLQGNTLNNKQPDSIVYKDDLIIVCEDKISFSDLFTEYNDSLCDFKKITNFLTSEVDLFAFKQKVSVLLNNTNIKIIGCLSSLESKNKHDNFDFISDIIIHISILRLEDNFYKITAYLKEEYSIYFKYKTLTIKL